MTKELPKSFIKKLQKRGFCLDSASDNQFTFVNDDSEFIEVEFDTDGDIWWATGIIKRNNKKDYWSSGSDGDYFFTDFKEIIFT